MRKKEPHSSSYYCVQRYTCVCVCGSGHYTRTTMSRVPSKNAFFFFLRLVPKESGKKKRVWNNQAISEGNVLFFYLIAKIKVESISICLGHHIDLVLFFLLFCFTSITLRPKVTRVVSWNCADSAQTCFSCLVLRYFFFHLRRNQT